MSQQRTLCICSKCGLGRDCTQMGQRDGRSICRECLIAEEKK
jgi:hypothetical protein